MLYIVATPIGNLEDITLRALRVLREVDYIAAEDTRHTRKLLTHYEIKTKLLSFHEHSSAEKRAHIIDMLRQELDIALVSDAGTPLVSDPGAELVREAAEQGIAVTSLPGACAAITALTLSGWGGSFCFVGFLSKKKAERQRQIETVAKSLMPCVLYESPHALAATLEALRRVAGQERRVVVAKELTKLHEQVFRGSLDDACVKFDGDLKGEYVLIVQECEEKVQEVTDEQIRAAVDDYLAAGMTKKDAAYAASKMLNIGKNRIYRLTL